MSSKNSINNDVAKLDAILVMVREEVLAAGVKHGPFKSPNEGYAVILKEADTLWDRIKNDLAYDESAMDEALQVAAMGIRYILDLSNGYIPDGSRGPNRPPNESASFIPLSGSDEVPDIAH